MRKVKTVLVDDLQGGPATETVWLMLDGQPYEIDLNAGNAGALREALRPYVNNARKGTGAPSVARPHHGPGEQALARLWARKNGHEVPEWGRLSTEVMRAWQESHATTPVAAPVFTG